MGLVVSLSKLRAIPIGRLEREAQTQYGHQIWKKLTAISDFSCDTEVDVILLGYRHATSAAGIALRRDRSDAKRKMLWDAGYERLYSTFPHYQAQDFEIVDCDLHSMDGENVFHGPCPSEETLKQGKYICRIGAAQPLGRFHEASLQHMLERRFNLPVLNLFVPAAGLHFALSEKLGPYITNAQMTIVQVLSGRSTGCDVYLCGWKTTDPETGEVHSREIVLRSIWKKDKAEFAKVVRRWNSNYLQSYQELANAINGPMGEVL